MAVQLTAQLAHAADDGLGDGAMVHGVLQPEAVSLPSG
jgi:hypothetical protein